MPKRITFVRVAMLLIFATVPVAFADISSVVVYGDSLSDNGNVFAVAGRPVSPPYYNGRFSNGPVAVELLATRLGVPLHDFAWGGATTGIGNYADGGSTVSFGALNLPGMLTELTNTAALVAGYSDALFVVWGGPNDYLAPAPGDTPADMVQRAVTNLLTIVYGLEGLGAHYILVPGMPDMSLTPFVSAQGPLVQAQTAMLVDGFNTALRANLPPGVLYFDTAAFMRSVVANPAAYGLLDVTSQCLVGNTVCPNPDQFLFWDDEHPTAAMHALVADQFLQAAVPEPASIWLTGGIAVLLGIRSRRTRRH